MGLPRPLRGGSLAGDQFLRVRGGRNRLLGGDPGFFLRGDGGESPLRRVGGDLLRMLSPFPSGDSLTPSRLPAFNFFLGHDCNIQ